MADKLTREQQMAVDDRGGKLLVSAAAGSGKTKVLVDRLLKYLTDPVAPSDLDEFLIITYTKAAASELRGKIASKLTERIAQDPASRLQGQMQRLYLTKISTVHGFCADILREYAYKLDLPADFRVADENECRELREQVMADLLDRAYETAQEDPDFLAFIDTQGVGRNDRLVPELIEKVYNSAKCHLDPEGWLDSCLRASEIEKMEDASETIWGKYLMDQLMEYLDCQIPVLEEASRQAQRCDGLEKVCGNLSQTLAALHLLRESRTWDEVVHRKEVPFPRYPTIKKCDDPELKDRVKAVRDACKDTLPGKLKAFGDPSVQVLEDLLRAAAGTRGVIRLVRRFDEEYSRAKKARRVLDFSDLEHKMLDLVLGRQRSGATAAAREISQRFREIMVDEYQDSNEVQDAIFSALSETKQNCFMVGDVKQSIYQFRLADPGIFLDKYAKYVSAEEAIPGQGRKILLSRNFRSGGEIVEAVNDVFSFCMTQKVGGLDYGADEALREGIPHKPLPDPAVELYGLQAREESYREEAEFVADRIQNMLRQATPVRSGDGFRPVTPDDIVILLRSPGSSGGYFQKVLEARGIRCMSGGGNNLLETPEIAMVRSLLETIQNPRLDIPLLSVLASPVFGFTADDLAAIRSARKYGSVYDALLADETEKSKSFVRVLSILRREARIKTLTELLESCFTLTRLDSIYASMAGGEVRSSNLQTFLQLAADYEMGSHRSLSQFLDHLTALEEKGLISAGSSAAGCVTIMSIHKSKGLEFPVVFLCGLSRKFNRESLTDRILCDKELGLGLSAADDTYRMRYPTVAQRAIAAKMASESLSEEMRVLYVAMTRARDRLVMTYMSQNLEKKLSDLAQCSVFDRGRLCCREVNCPGDWVMLTALHKTEAGEFFRLGGKAGECFLGQYPWKIAVDEAPSAASAEEQGEELKPNLPDGICERLRDALSFRYEHEAATMVPSKQTATGRKGRVKDEEAAQDTPERREQIHRSWRKPSFAAARATPMSYGNAMHAAMQYICYAQCTDENAVQEQIRSLVSEGFLSREQGDLVSCADIARFFDTEVGKKLQNGAPHLREFKFSILDDARNYDSRVEDERVLLQGVVDCALLEDAGITIIDFKTDAVTEESLSETVERYRLQIETYGEALGRIYEKKVVKKLLYFFRLNRFVEV